LGVRRQTQEPFVETLVSHLLFRRRRRRVCKKLEALLDRGIVPDDFRARQGEIITIEDASREYVAAHHISDSEKRCLAVVVSRVGATRVRSIDYQWGENWVTAMKIDQNLSPVTIRHHVGTLARCFDWGARHGIAALAVNPLRLLPKRYAVYTSANVKAAVALDGIARTDVERDQRLESGHETRIRAILAGEKCEDKQRPLELRWQAALECMFDLALETALRMREIYTLSTSQIDIEARTIFLDKTKNGDKRQVPLPTPAIRAIKTYQKHVRRGDRGMEGFKFDNDRFLPLWDGGLEPAALRETTSKLSRQFARVFDAAKCPELRFHDLRHEATSRLFERTRLSDIEISRITGHKDLESYGDIRICVVATSPTSSGSSGGLRPRLPVL
jgi:integrase